MEAIGYSAFDHCQNLGGQLVIPAEVTSIGNCAFAYTKVTSLSFAENSILETIGIQAFCNCTDLEFAVIPASVSSIGGAAFSVCNHLSTIVVLPATPPVLGDQAFLALGTNTVYVGDLANYPEGWGGFKSVKSVGELEGTIKDDALAAISQAAQGMELYDEETAISAIDAAMQGMTLTPTETTVVNGHKAQILASVSVYAIEAVRAEAAESMADSQIWVWKKLPCRSRDRKHVESSKQVVEGHDGVYCRRAFVCPSLFGDFFQKMTDVKRGYLTSKRCVATLFSVVRRRK